MTKRSRIEPMGNDSSTCKREKSSPQLKYRPFSKARSVLSSKSIYMITLLIVTLIFWSAAGFIFNVSSSPESLEISRNKPMVVSWGTVAEMDYDVLVDRMEKSVDQRFGVNFISTIKLDKEFRPNTATSIDTMKNGTCVVLTPTNGENSPYGVCKVGNTYSIIAWIRVKYHGKMDSDVFEQNVILTPNTKYVTSSKGGRISVITKDMEVNKVTAEGRRNLISGCGYAEVSTCVEKTPRNCSMQVIFMNRQKKLLFKRDRYYWCPKNSEYIGMEMHRHKFGYFNRVFLDIYMDLPSIDLEIHKTDLVIFRDKGTALEVVGIKEKLAVYVQLLIIILPLFYVSIFSTQHTDSTHSSTITFMDLAYRLSTMNIIFVQVLYFSYDDLFLIAYGIAHFASLSLGVHLVVLRAVFNTVLVVIIGANVTLKWSNPHCAFEKLNAFLGLIITAMVILLSAIMIVYYSTPSLEKGTLCDFKYASICKNLATCCSEDFSFSAGHFALYFVAMAFIIGCVRYSHTIKARSSKSKLTAFEKLCINGEISKFIQDFQNDEALVINDGHARTSALAVAWLGFIGVKGVGLVRVKDAYLVLLAYFLPTRRANKMNASLVVWLCKDGRDNEISCFERVYLGKLKELIPSPLRFFFKDVGSIEGVPLIAPY